MKIRLLDHLVCPLDRSPLQLTAWDTTERILSSEDRARALALKIDPASLTTEVMSGVLVNPQRKLLYPIYRGVPRLLTFASGVSAAFSNEFQQRLSTEFPGYSLPQEASMPGEADVLRTFSSEWVNYDWDGMSYWNLTPAVWFQCMRFAIGIDQQPVQGQLVLEVGTGIGGTADYLARAEGCETVGMDLGNAIDVGFQHFGANPFLHLVQGSAFAPPFCDQSFDFVYSFGVIHHTFSTQTAFQSVCRLPRAGGRLYIWVYSPYDENRTLTRRGLMLLEQMVRPVVWRLPERAQAVALSPLIPLYIGYQWLRKMKEGGGHVNYGVREAMHAARDRFTPRYIHRHTDEELSDWFRQAGYSQLTCDSQRPKPDFVPIAFTANTGVSGIRTEPAPPAHGTETTN